jgi:hypothetical protein
MARRHSSATWRRGAPGGHDGGLRVWAESGYSGGVQDEIHTVLWLFGRGLSLGCGLDWDDLLHCPQLPRDEKIQCIREKLTAAMNARGVNREPIRDFLQFLSARTLGRWRHRFMTTNWDFLLQQEIDNLSLPHQRHG